MKQLTVWITWKGTQKAQQFMCANLEIADNALILYHSPEKDSWNMDSVWKDVYPLDKIEVIKTWYSQN